MSSDFYTPVFANAIFREPAQCKILMSGLAAPVGSGFS